ncbi:MAG: hypothetical protein WAM41_00625 [Psychrobacillus psychrotolerans]
MMKPFFYIKVNLLHRRQLLVLYTIGNSVLIDDEARKYWIKQSGSRIVQLKKEE